MDEFHENCMKLLSVINGELEVNLMWVMNAWMNYGLYFLCVYIY